MATTLRLKNKVYLLQTQNDVQNNLFRTFLDYGFWILYTKYFELLVTLINLYVFELLFVIVRFTGLFLICHNFHTILLDTSFENSTIYSGINMNNILI
jgi:hypothetical protein